MTLTPEQQRVVEQNMGLVGKVIQDKVHGLGRGLPLRMRISFRLAVSVCAKQQPQIKAAASLLMPTD